MIRDLIWHRFGASPRPDSVPPPVPIRCLPSVITVTGTVQTAYIHLHCPQWGSRYIIGMATKRTQTRDILTRRFGSTYMHPKIGGYLCLEQQTLQFLLWGAHLSRECLAIMLQLMSHLSFSAGETNNFEVRVASRYLSSVSGIHRRHLHNAIARLVALGLLRIAFRGRRQTGRDDLGASAIYDLRPLFDSLGRWLESDRPVAEPKPEVENASIGTVALKVVG